MIFYHVLSEAIAYQGKPLDLNNSLKNSQYLENIICQVLVLQSIETNVLCNLTFTGKSEKKH